MSTQAVLAPTGQAGEPITYMGMQVTFRVTKEMSGGTLQAFEHLTPPGTGVPLHTHVTDEETLFVEQGRLMCRIGEETFAAHTGESVALPAGIPHAWRCDGDDTALVLVVASLAPGGDFERMFRRLSTMDPDKDAGIGVEACRDNGIDLPVPFVLP